MNNKQVPPSVAQFAVKERAELLARIAEQAREIERLRLNIAEYNEHERCYQAEIAALKAQPRGVVPPTKAQGVVIPAELDRAFITGESCDGVYRVVIQSETLKEMQAVHSWLTRLNAAPAAPAADAPPESCRQRLAAEGKPYPRSSCAACGQFSPKWRECDAAIAAHCAKGVV